MADQSGDISSAYDYYLIACKAQNGLYLSENSKLIHVLSISLGRIAEIKNYEHENSS